MTKNTTFIAIFILALNILIVWLPNQFQTAGIQEEWRWRATFDGGVTTYNDIGSDSSEEQFYTRPFLGMLNGLSFILGTESFIGLHILTILLLWVKAWGLFMLMKVLFSDHPLWGYLCAIILVFYPSDIGVVSFRPIMHHLAVLTVIWSIVYMVKFYQTGKKWYWAIIVLLQLVATLSVETPYPVFLVAPVIILLLEKRISKRFLLITTLYYIVPAIILSYSVFLIVVADVSWQRTAIASYTIRDYIRNIYRLYEHNFFEAWRDIITYFFTDLSPSDLFVFIATIISSFLGGIWIYRQSKPQSTAISRKVFLIVLFLAGGAVLAGYGMFLPSRTHVNTDFRVYLLSSLGLATVFGTVGYALYTEFSKSIVRYIVLFAFCVLVGLSGVFANKTHHEFLDISNTQEQIMRQITDVVPALSQPAYIVIKTPSNEVNYRVNISELQKPVLFTPMLQVIYNDYENILGGVICFKEYLTCDFSSPDSMDIQASNFLNLDLPIPYEQMILFDITKDQEVILITEDETLEGYNPMALIDTSADPPPRIRTIYGAD